MDRRVFVGSLAAGAVGVASGGLSAAPPQSALDALRAFVESRGGSVVVDRAWDVVRQNHLVMISAIIPNAPNRGIRPLPVDAAIWHDSVSSEAEAEAYIEKSASQMLSTLLGKQS